MTKELLKGNVIIPLFEDRYSNLVEMNNLLKRSGKSFYELIKDLNVDSQLFEFIVSNLDYFKDVSTYDDKFKASVDISSLIFVPSK